MRTADAELCAKDPDAGRFGSGLADAAIEIYRRRP